MRALVYHGPGRKSWDEVPDPDDRVGVDTTTICGTDLHILKGDVPTVDSGRILGHEAVGTVTQVGAAVKNAKPGDRVLISCITACGGCRYCTEGHYGQCLGGGGWILGHRIDGTQAEYVRVPFADRSTHVLAEDIPDENALMLADIIPTSYEVGVLNARVSPADTVVIVGCGPIGLAAIATARLFTPARVIAVDILAGRLEQARQFGADFTIDSTADDPVELVRQLTDEPGADVAIEAVGVPASFELCTRLVRPGGRIANIGVHGKPVTLHLEELWIKNISITTGLVDTFSTPSLLTLIATGHIDPRPFITHRFTLNELITAYDVFTDAGKTQALKVALTRR